MPDPLRQVHWVSQLRGRPILYVLLSVPAVAVLATAYAFASLSFPPGVREWSFFGLLPIFLSWGVWVFVILTGPDKARPAKVEAGARRCGLAFADRPTGDAVELPAEFPMARASAQWWLPGRRGPRNLAYGEVGGRRVVVFDIAYPFLGSDFQGRCETTAVYFPDPAPGLPDWPVGGTRYEPQSRMGPPEPFAAVLAANPVWAVECRGGRLLIYRPFHLCDPESYPEFVAAAAHVYADLVATAAGKRENGDRQADGVEPIDGLERP